ncbi:hypothetical protein RGF97_15875 [Streptomyces roseicoloratus]|uniref:Uncharacterized protein n=1 Tax=Streptomyces roseicoloratus TaxID=2508722 RepID=A0ABY9RV03_9ACTN|nr:hypothetical protein [Streptomyces roseicoloratus]WMX46029.1 hypothetical protein RGF97_15875 [Streptomyces roseicoloratus]
MVLSLPPETSATAGLAVPGVSPAGLPRPTAAVTPIAATIAAVAMISGARRPGRPPSFPPSATEL